MLLKSLEFLLRSETRCRRYLAEQCWQKKRRFCVRCRSRRIYHLAERRYRCARCGYTFQDFTGRWVGQLNLSSRQWLWLLKLLEFDIPTARMAHEVGISYPTALKAVRLIRCAIVQQTEPDEDADTEHSVFYSACQSRLPPPEAAATPIFGVVERDGRVEIRLAKGVTVEALADAQVKTVKAGLVVYTDRFGGYDALLFCRSRRTDHARRLARGKLQPDERLEEFWSFAKERLGKGVSRNNFSLCLKELQFRYNHRREQMFELLAGYVTRLVPKSLYFTSRSVFSRAASQK